MDHLAYWIGFNKVRGIGPQRFRALIDCCGSVEAAWRAPESTLRDAGLDRRSATALIEARDKLDLEAELARVRKSGAQIITWDDPAYPQRLLNIYDPPFVIFVRGELAPEDDFGVAVVGTRRASHYGREAARAITTDLARAGVTIISGLAVGIDTVAHRAALDSGGRTLAVLGSSVDIIYPWENSKLANEIVQHGALISEYALGTQPEASNFPPRNRIVSGLSRGVVVIEAGEQSGALITARMGGEQGRDVFAVPGSIFHPGSQGANRLIRDGATPVLSATDILDALNLRSVPQQVEAQMLFPTDATEAQLLEQLGPDPLHVDEVSRATGLPIATVTGTLALMELKGLVHQAGGMTYVRARESGPVYRNG